MEFAYCGLKCRECPVYRATVSKDSEKQIALAVEYSTDDCQFTKEDMICLGCHSDMPSENMCRDCEIRTCGIEKACKNCAECDSFPCSVLDKYLDDSSVQRNNLMQLAAAYKKAK
ncbi:MAG: DUF3795 domain-containing protein [Lachnospiraceae bacterium]|nr:DUF3795 domain-containing protein [Lachnospiraceae bacterium]